MTERKEGDTWVGEDHHHYVLIEGKPVRMILNTVEERINAAEERINTAEEKISSLEATLKEAKKNFFDATTRCQKASNASLDRRRKAEWDLLKARDHFHLEKYHLNSIIKDMAEGWVRMYKFAMENGANHPAAYADCIKQLDKRFFENRGEIRHEQVRANKEVEPV